MGARLGHAAVALDPRIEVPVARLHAELRRFYGERLVELVLFGSWARGEAEAGSDIDVLVVLEGPVHPGTEIRNTGEIVARLSLKDGVVFSCLFMDAVTYTGGGGPLLRNIRREGVAL
jgi:predicted nucleotidyltransferase